MWTSISIAGSPRILMVDASENPEGWEQEFSERLSGSLRRTGLHLDLVRIQNDTELTIAEKFTFNCLLLFAKAEKARALLNIFPNKQAFLLALCTPSGFNAEISEEILKSNPAVAPLAIAPLSLASPRETGLFYLKFFAELKLHSSDNISGKMVWFSFSKAKELLRRRRYSSKFGVRC